MSNSVAVNEIFGPTIQGEGKSMGMPAMFLRLAGCNLKCVWCDTAYSWDKTRGLTITRMSCGEIYDQLTKMCGSVRNLVLTGGEPMLQQRAVDDLLCALHREGWWIEVETAGTIAPFRFDRANLYTVSIKLENSLNPEHYRIRPEVIRVFQQSGRAIFKFVAQSEKDFPEIKALVDQYGLNPVYIMPEGITGEAIKASLLRIIHPTIEHGYNLTTRMQVQIYDNRRAV